MPSIQLTLTRLYPNPTNTLCSSSSGSSRRQGLHPIDPNPVHHQCLRIDVLHNRHILFHRLTREDLSSLRTM
uniref:Uncharacterized protein n=1 Tax=Cryptococcus bacillisporus CA1280 TaxID=1296109 RepID=A0A0D0TUQ8_CRYGA|nr:hypothetical protein I312_00273 [Cryptococcus bacillisporus CA1280]